MRSSAFVRSLGSPRDLAILVLVSGLSFFFCLGKQPIVRRQELRVLETAREMGKRGDLILPYFLGEPRLEKPPLAYWLTLGGFLIRGEPDEAGGRLYSAAAGVLTVLVLYGFGRSQGRTAAGLWAGLVLATSSLFYRGARRAETDVLMDLAVAAALICFFRALEAAGEERRRIRIWSLLGWAAMAVGVLAKGPVGLLFVLVPVSLFLAASRRWRGFARVFLPAGPVLFLALVLPWFIAVAARNGMAFDVFLREAEKTTGGDGHAPPTVLGAIFYYLNKVWPNFLPWCVLLPPAIWTAVRSVRRDRCVAFVLSWLGGILLLLQLNGNKQEHYLVPLLPPLAFLVGVWIAEVAPRTRFLGPRWFPLAARGLLAGALLVLLWWSFNPLTSREARKSPRDFYRAALPLLAREEADAPVYFNEIADLQYQIASFYLRRVVVPLPGGPAEVNRLLLEGRPFFVIVPGRPPDGLPPGTDAAYADPRLEEVLRSAPPEPPLRIYRAVQSLRS